MSRKKKNIETDTAETVQDTAAQPGAEPSATVSGEPAVTLDPCVALEAEKATLMLQLAESQDRYLRLAAEFDNYRKRTLREKSELIQTAGEDVLRNILPLMDDFDRSLQAMEMSGDLESLREGVRLIHSKFVDFLSRKGVREMDAAGAEFNADLHEALTTVPVEDAKNKGKVVDVLQKGYTLNDKIIRFAKVVVGQ
jgi:molecular chaperone GrpE